MRQRYWPEVAVEWIVVAGLSEARVFVEDDEFEGLKLIAELHNPLGRERDRDLRRHEPGWTARESAKEDVIEQFALEIFRFLNHHWIEEEFDHLEIFAPPKLLGSIRNHFPEKFLKVTKFIPRDLEKKTGRDLEDHIYLKEGY